MLCILLHLTSWVCLGFAFSSYFPSVVISYLHNLVFAFLQLLGAVAINGPASSDAFRMGPSLWILFAAHVQLQPSTPRLVLDGVLSSLAFGLRQWRVFVVLSLPRGEPVLVSRSACWEGHNTALTGQSGCWWWMWLFPSTIQCLWCALDVGVPCLTVLCSTVLSTTEASLFVFH